MSIELRCEKCGKLIQAPKERAGSQFKCPSCESDIYIPTPEDELEELPLEPEDAYEIERIAALKKEQQRLDRILAKENGPSSGAKSPAHKPAERGEGLTANELIIVYLTAMRDTDLSHADQALAALLRQREEARKVLDRLVTDQVPPRQMADVPPAVYQGFLKNLRSQL